MKEEKTILDFKDIDEFIDYIGNSEDEFNKEFQYQKMNYTLSLDKKNRIDPMFMVLLILSLYNYELYAIFCIDDELEKEAKKLFSEELPITEFNKFVANKILKDLQNKYKTAKENESILTIYDSLLTLILYNEKA